MALSLVIASVPVALPMVMQITMAIGARKMADHKAIVTHLTALQEIASMTVLCSDKTGTLTTANITVMPDQIWMHPDSGCTRVSTYRLKKRHTHIEFISLPFNMHILFFIHISCCIYHINILYLYILYLSIYLSI